MRRLALILAAAWLGGHAAAQTGGADAKAAPSAQLVRQKDILAARLLADVPALERVAASGDAEAKGLVARARENYRKALAALKSDDHAQANVLLNDVIAAMARARHLVPDPEVRMREERLRNEQLGASLRSLRQSYREQLAHSGRETQDDAAWRSVSQLIEQAESLAATQRVAESNRLLLQAESVQLDAFGPLLSGKTLIYAPHFRDPGDEFRFELERNRDYDALVPLALAELKPTEGARKLVERYVASSEDLRRTAMRRAATADYSGALAAIRAGTVYLQRALLAAGLVVPQEGGM